MGFPLPQNLLREYVAAKGGYERCDDDGPDWEELVATMGADNLAKETWGVEAVNTHVDRSWKRWRGCLDAFLELLVSNRSNPLRETGEWLTKTFRRLEEPNKEVARTKSTLAIFAYHKRVTTKSLPQFKPWSRPQNLVLGHKASLRDGRENNEKDVIQMTSSYQES